MSRYPTIDGPSSDLDSNGLPYENGNAPLTAFGSRDAVAAAQLRNLLQQGLIQFGDRSRQEAQEYREQLIQQRSLAHESAANDALNRFRYDSLHAYGNYSATSLGDALKGYEGYRQALQTSRTAAMSDLSSAARSLLQPAIDSFYHEALQLGLQHRFEQDHAWSDQSSLDTLATNQREAVMRRNDPSRVQALADHGVSEWVKIGERKGWNDEQINQQLGQSKAQLFAAVIKAHLQDGNVAQAQATLDRAQGQVDPEMMRKLMRDIQIPDPTQIGANLGTSQHPSLVRFPATDDGQQVAQSPTLDDLAKANPSKSPNDDGSPARGAEGQGNAVPESERILPDSKQQKPARLDPRLPGKQKFIFDPYVPLEQKDPPLDYGEQQLTKALNEASVPDESQPPAVSFVPRENDRFLEGPERIGDRPVDRNEMYGVLDFDPKGHGEWHVALRDDPFWYPFIARSLRNKMDDVLRKLREDHVLPYNDFAHNNEYDAIRHTLWSFLVTRRMGSERAKMYGDAHEITLPDPDGERLMDLYNNRIGRILANDLNNVDREPLEVILDAYKRGLLRTKPFTMQPSNQ